MEITVHENTIQSIDLQSEPTFASPKQSIERVYPCPTDQASTRSSELEVEFSQFLLIICMSTGDCLPDTHDVH